MNPNDIEATLLADGWTPFKNFTYSDYVTSYYRRFPTPTPCQCNDEKPGRQIELYHANYDTHHSFSVETSAQLADGTWFRSSNSHTNLSDATRSVGRLLAAWEAAANFQPAENVTSPTVTAP